MALQASVIRYRAEATALRELSKKRCTKCKEIKNITDFSGNRRKFDGLSLQCTICQSRGWFQRHGKRMTKGDEAEHAFLREQSALDQDGKRRCRGCHQVHPIATHFPHRSKEWARFIDYCVACTAPKRAEARRLRAIRGQAYTTKHRLLKWAKKCIASHKERGYVISVTSADILRLFDQHGVGVCHYTGDEIRVGYGASIDVKMPSGPFSVDNICFCSTASNTVKAQMSATEFAAYLESAPEVMRRIRKHNEKWVKRYLVDRIPLEKLLEIARGA